ncbi:Clavaminate synthase-like protein [Diplocarpon rosae]|nr:Clavaminate synthase-like protein [Diplocarpon rosae]
MAVKPLIVHLLKAPNPSFIVDFGVEIDHVELENLSEANFQVIRNTVFNSHVVVIRNQAGISAIAQYELTKRFDPTSESYGHGKTLDAKRSILYPDLKTIPHQPQVQVIGDGTYEEYEGLKSIKLVHPHHKTFHKVAIPAEDDLDATRFYRWHIDAALYAFNPPRVTSLLAIKVPAGRRQSLRHDDGTGEEMDVPLGTTAFVSGQNMYKKLSEKDKEFISNAKVEYAPHPYIWTSPAKSRSDGLGIFSEGLELLDSELPPVDEEAIKALPMC